MNALWDAYWPPLTAAAVIGVLIGVFALRATPARRPKSRQFKRRAALAIAAGIALSLALGALWHDAMGAGNLFAYKVEQQARRTLDDYEMVQVHGLLERDPLRRTLVLEGPADDFQRAELVRIMDALPGVATVRWADTAPRTTLPLLAEAELAALLCFGLGLMLSYILELRRRYRAQWSW